jgi:hypothetical protein
MASFFNDRTRLTSFSMPINRFLRKCEAEIMVLGIYPVLLAWAKRLRNWVLMKRERFSEQEHNEFALEICRLNLVIDIHKLFF